MNFFFFITSRPDVVWEKDLWAVFSGTVSDNDAFMFL